MFRFSNSSSIQCIVPSIVVNALVLTSSSDSQESNLILHAQEPENNMEFIIIFTFSKLKIINICVGQTSLSHLGVIFRDSRDIKETGLNLIFHYSVLYDGSGL